MEALGKLSVDLLVVDDNSPDGTGKLADELAAKHPFVHVCIERKSRLRTSAIAPASNGRWPKNTNSFSKWTVTSRMIRKISRAFSRRPRTPTLYWAHYKGGIRVINWPLTRLILSLGAAKYVQWITGMPPAILPVARAFGARRWRPSISGRFGPTATVFKSSSPTKSGGKGCASARCRSCLPSAWKANPRCPATSLGSHLDGVAVALPKRPATLATQEIIMNNIRVGIVGTGFMAVAHLRAYEAMDGIEIGALCNPSGRNWMDDFSDVHGNVGSDDPVKLDMTNVAAYRSLGELLADESIDLIDITTPTFLHHEQAFAALPAANMSCAKNPWPAPAHKPGKSPMPPRPPEDFSCPPCACVFGPSGNG